MDQQHGGSIPARDIDKTKDVKQSIKTVTASPNINTNCRSTDGDRDIAS